MNVGFHRISLQLSLGALVLLVAQGCGGAGGGSDTISVSGTVTYDGAPLANAAVAFVPDGPGVMGTAQTDADGAFTLEAAPGANKVSVSKVAGGGTIEGDGTMPAEGEPLPAQPKSEIPEKYNNPKTSGLTANVASGMEPVKLELTSK